MFAIASTCFFRLHELEKAAEDRRGNVRPPEAARINEGVAHLRAKERCRASFICPIEQRTIDVWERGHRVGNTPAFVLGGVENIEQCVDLAA